MDSNQILSVLLMLYQTTNFQHNLSKTPQFINLRGTFTLHLDSSHNLDPSNHLDKISDTKPTLISQCSLNI